MSDVTALTCPNCGGSVDIPASHADIVKCPYCQTTLQLPTHPEPPPEVRVEPAIDSDVQARMQEALARARTASKPSRRASILSVILAIITIAGIGIGLAAAFFPIFNRNSLSLWDGVVPLPPAETGTPDLLAVVRQGDEDNIRLALLDGKTRAARWVSSESFNNSSHLPPIPGGDQVYFLDGNNLLAYSTATGKLAWQKTLATGVDISCKGCVRLVDGQLIILPKDGALQALNPSTGQQTWSVALNTSPRELLLAGGRPAVVDQNSQKNNILQIFDGRTGQVVQEYGAGCQAAGAKQPIGHGLEEAYLSPDGSQVYLMYYGFGDAPCAQKIDLATGQPLWTMQPAEGQVWPSAWFASEVLVSDQGVFFYEDNSLSMIDANTGELRFLFKEPRYREVTPLVSQPGLVVVLAIPDYDSDLKELWGIDTNTGKKTWTYKMQAKSIIDPYQVKLTSAGLVVVQCLRDAKSSQWEVLNPLTGASLGKTQLSDQDYNFLEDSWTPTTAYLKIDNLLYVVDVKTGAVQYTWP